MQTVAEGPDWVATEYRRDILPGSALDFSGMGIHDAPAGKYGWLVSRDSHAEFEGRTGVPARFYGVNFCNSANYLSDDEIERVTDRLVRLGYNALRIHHHDSAWAEVFFTQRRRDAEKLNGESSLSGNDNQNPANPVKENSAALRRCVRLQSGASMPSAPTGGASAKSPRHSTPAPAHCVSPPPRASPSAAAFIMKSCANEGAPGARSAVSASLGETARYLRAAAARVI